MARSQGNPFYLEELLNYVRDRGLDPADLNQNRTARQFAHADPQPHRPVERAREDHPARGEHRRAAVPRRVADGLLSRIGWLNRSEI